MATDVEKCVCVSRIQWLYVRDFVPHDVCGCLNSLNYSWDSFIALSAKSQIWLARWLAFGVCCCIDVGYHVDHVGVSIRYWVSCCAPRCPCDPVCTSHVTSSNMSVAGFSGDVMAPCWFRNQHSVPSSCTILLACQLQMSGHLEHIDAHSCWTYVLCVNGYKCVSAIV